MADTDNALMTIIKTLTPLSSEERRRAVDAALVYLGETGRPETLDSRSREAVTETGDNDGGYPATAVKWMRQNAISSERLDKVFHFQDDGFDIHDVPGKSKRERTLNAYILTGVGTYLAKGDKAFDDSLARGFCETIGCYDPANHAKYIKEKGAEFSGDKKKGYTLTNVGIRRGAELVRELADASA